MEDVNNESGRTLGQYWRRAQAACGGWEERSMYTGTMLDDLIGMVEKAEREAATREMLEGELEQARVYTLIWNVPLPTQRYLSQGVA